MKKNESLKDELFKKQVEVIFMDIERSVRALKETILGNDE